MAISEVVKLARVQRDRDLINQLFDLVKHPIYSVVLSFAFIEYLQSRKMMGENVGTLLEAGIIAAPVLTAVANSGALEAMTRVPADMLKSISSLVPAGAAALIK